MKQVVFKKGSAMVIDTEPSPLENGTVLVELRASCISPGTEMSSLNASGKTLIEKAKAHPDKLKRSLARMKTEGMLAVVQKARENQSKDRPSGYSAAGVVLGVADDVEGFQKGMRVAVAGAGYANHAEFAVIPVNLSMPIPENVSFQEASTCALGGIAMQGVRRAETSLGEIVVVIGCGAIGLLTIQLLKASGCRVVAIDMDARRLEISKKLGADATFHAAQENLPDIVVHFSDGYGVDKAIITAATDSNTLLSNAFKMCRKKGRVVLVGVIGPEFNRREMYAKELDFVISTSYGPGRYDEQYERFGNDYPYGYVRWTEKRNIEAYLKCIASGSVRLEEIIEKTFSVDEASRAFADLKEKKLLLVTLEYAKNMEPVPEKKAYEFPIGHREWHPPKEGAIRVGIVGAGSFIQSMHIPHLKRLNDRYQVVCVCNRSGLSARQAAKHFPDCKATTRLDELLASGIDMVMIGTRHNTHADITKRAMEAGKAVFVEKPMCITRNEYKELCVAVDKNGAPFMIGYNRRFSPFAIRIQEKIQNRVNPLIMQYTMNAGYVPPSAWVHTPEGGGRIIGEACHIFDLFRFLVGSSVVSISVDALKPKTASVRWDDNIVVTVKYEDGSLGTLLYTGLGSKTAPKEKMKVFCDEQLFVLDDYKKLKTYGISADWTLKKQDKGHFRELQVFAKYIQRGDRFPITWKELKETWEITRKIADSMRLEM
jgi:predicted dehydrogenase/threonine dehydrogenase-like Zn-dependent dehydrogenase